MAFPHKLDVLAGGVWLLPGDEGDLPGILTLWDETVAWLVAKGVTGQWGTTPFSQLPAMRERFLLWLRRGEFFVARERMAPSGPIVGTLALVDTIPGYAASAWGQAPEHGLYLEAFTTARMLRGSGLGRGLLRWAEAYTVEQGKAFLRLDCWAENQALYAYYCAAGFQPHGTFRLGAWEGQMFEKCLSHAGSDE